MENTAVVICLHGDELFGLEILDSLANKVPIFIGNPLAIEKKIRFLESDLNRVFPGKEDGNYEERRAAYLLKKLQKFKYVIDIHSSSRNMELFGIITKPNKNKIELAKKLGLKKVVFMPEKFAKGKSLIDNLDCSISLEIGPHEKKENVTEIVNAISNPLSNTNENSQFFEIFDIINGGEDLVFFIENFEEVKKGEIIAKGDRQYYAEYDFIPIFVNEKAYKNIICLAARRITPVFLS